MDKKQARDMSKTRDLVDHTDQYVRDYIAYFRDHVGIPEDRMHVIVEGPIGGFFSQGVWMPRRTRLVIDLVHECFITVVFLGYFEAWKEDKGKWILTRWYGGTVMPSDGSGPYELRDGPGSSFLPTVRRLLEIDQERPLTCDDLSMVVKGPAVWQ
jgi:hypothetical protein